MWRPLLTVCIVCYANTINGLWNQSGIGEGKVYGGKNCPKSQVQNERPFMCIIDLAELDRSVSFSCFHDEVCFCTVLARVVAESQNYNTSASVEQISMLVAAQAVASAACSITLFLATVHVALINCRLACIDFLMQ